MTDRKIDMTDLQKALQGLQDLAKGHGSTGTATTAVPGMVGESGPSQLFHTPNNSDPGTWAGSSWRGEGWEDMISSNGTDLESVRRMGKSIASGIAAKLAKGEPLTGRETNFVVKGGMNFLADKDDEKKNKEVEKSHPDAKEDAKQIKEMVKPGALAKSDVNKSLEDHARENAQVNQGLEISEFLGQFAVVMSKSLQSMEARITDRVTTAIAKGQQDDAAAQNELAKSLGALGEVLTLHAQRIDQIEQSPARGAKSQLVSKSQATGYREPGAEQTPELSKSFVTGRLLEMVKKSECTPQDVLKYDASGELSPELLRKVAGR